MPLGRPRRIFRASPLAMPRVPRPVLAAGVLAAGAIAAGVAGLGHVLPGLTARPGPQAAQEAAHVAAGPTQIAVLDGDTLRLRDVVVRLLGIAAPPRGQSCRGADGSGFDCGAAATNALADLVRARSVDCLLAGRDGMGHTLGVCEASGRQINRALVASGYARAEGDDAAGGSFLHVADLRGDEDQARAQRRGLWAARASSW